MSKIALAYDKSEYGNADVLALKSVWSTVDCVKVGLEAIAAQAHRAYGGSSVADVLREVARLRRKEFFWDQKICDIKNTVERALTNICKRPGITMTTVMANISEGALRAAANVCSEHGVLALAVTVLTDINEKECCSIFGDRPDAKVLQFARRAKAFGFGGLVCSAQELKYLRENKIDLRFIVPGTRSVGVPTNDQQRVMTPKEAADLGAHYLIIGRQIMESPNPRAAALAIRDELA